METSSKVHLKNMIRDDFNLKLSFSPYNGLVSVLGGEQCFPLTRHRWLLTGGFWDRKHLFSWDEKWYTSQNILDILKTRLYTVDVLSMGDSLKDLSDCLKGCQSKLEKDFDSVPDFMRALERCQREIDFKIVDIKIKCPSQELSRDELFVRYSKWMSDTKSSLI